MSYWRDFQSVKCKIPQARQDDSKLQTCPSTKRCYKLHYIKHQRSTAATHITKCQTEDFNTLASTWNEEDQSMCFKCVQHLVVKSVWMQCSICFEDQKVTGLSAPWNYQPRPRYRPVDAEDGRIDTSSYDYALWRILKWSKALRAELGDIMIDVWQPSPTFHSKHPVSDWLLQETLKLMKHQRSRTPSQALKARCRTGARGSAMRATSGPLG